jgi:ATP-binding cassette subfamily B protein RaxB
MAGPLFPFLRFFHRQRLPILLQTEAAECSLACLAMVAGFWGFRTDLASLRRRFSISLKGMTLKNLISMSQTLDLTSRPVRVDLLGISGLQLPCILHWEMNHFVVLKKVCSRHVIIHDPAVGERRVSLEDVSKRFTGVALELTPRKQFRPAKEIQQFTLLSLMGNVSGLKRGLLQILLLGITLQLCVLAAPFYIQWTVDEVLVTNDRNLITVLGVGFFLLVLVQTAISAFRAWATTVLATSLNFQWLANAFTHLMRLPLPYFEKRHLGDIVSRFGSIKIIQDTLTLQFVEGIIDGLLVICTFSVMLLYSVQLTAVASGAVGLYALLRFALLRSLREATSEEIIHAAKQQTHFLESVRGVQSLRLFTREEERRIGWMNILVDQFNAELRISRLSISYQNISILLFGAERIIVIWLAALAVLDNLFSVGMLFAFISYKDQFSQRVSALIDKLFELRMLRLHGERVADILLTEADQDTGDAEMDTKSIIPTLEIRNVSFRYSDNEPYVLEDLSLSIPVGQFIAITGASGCGKTTLIKLLLGLLEPTKGEILVGGMLIKHVGLTSYRQLIGTVMQDDQLFAGSIAENISFFDSVPKQSQIEACAKQAGIHTEILAMPMAYNTLVGDIGSGLSGGQKQRILLARALYKRPKILVLDEATSHLDVLNEKAVNEAIKKLSLTRILIAHRPETISMAQRVVVLELGQIVSRNYKPESPESPTS